MKNLKMLVSSLALLLSVSVVLLGCDGDKGTGGGGGGGNNTGGGTNTGGNNTSGGKYDYALSCGNRPCKTVEMPDGKTWMAENLNYQTDNSKCYGNYQDSCAKYGRLYALDEALVACPSGWRLASQEDWDGLAVAVGGKKASVYREDLHTWDDVGTKLKSKDGWNWNDNGNVSGNGTDDFGFSALPGGSRTLNGMYSGAGDRGVWWTSTKYMYDESWFYCKTLSNNSAEDRLSEGFDSNGIGLMRSVRCIKN